MTPRFLLGNMAFCRIFSCCVFDSWTLFGPEVGVCCVLYSPQYVHCWGIEAQTNTPAAQWAVSDNNPNCNSLLPKLCQLILGIYTYKHRGVSGLLAVQNPFKYTYYTKILYSALIFYICSKYIYFAYCFLFCRPFPWINVIDVQTKQSPLTSFLSECKALQDCISRMYQKTFSGWVKNVYINFYKIYKFNNSNLTVISV